MVGDIISMDNLRCSTCGELFTRSSIEGKEAPSTVECIPCRSDAVVHNEDVQHLFTHELVLFFNRVLGLPLDEWNIQVTMCAHEELRVSSPNGGVDQVHTGECISSVSVHHVRLDDDDSTSDLIHKRTVKEIRLLKGMHVELVARTIAHEAMHGWIALWRGQPCGTSQCHACPPKLQDVVAEGLCEYAAFTFLEHRQREVSPESHRFKVIEYTKAKMLTNTCGVYARGLKLALAAMSPRGASTLKRSKNSAFFKECFALSTFPKQILTPVKYNGEMSASLGLCDHCCREIEPSSTTSFEFVVLGGGKACVCLECYEASRPRCKWCGDSLYKKPSIKGPSLHKECFLAYEREHGDQCPVCGESLWEEEKASGSFVRRSSYTSGGGSGGGGGRGGGNRDQRHRSAKARGNSYNHGRIEVHERCGDRCSFCKVLFKNEKYMTVKQDKLHDKCFDGYQIQAQMICSRCKTPLWRKTPEGSYARKTRMIEGGNEIHSECGDKCAQCHKILGGKFMNLEGVRVHETCFDSYQRATPGMCCGVCHDPLWRRGDGDSSGGTGYGRRTCTGKANAGEIHVECSEKCVYCKVILFDPSPYEMNSGRRGSIVTVEKESEMLPSKQPSKQPSKHVHDACYLLYQHSKKEECCSECGSGLWLQEDNSFQRRSSVTEDDRHLCSSCAEKMRRSTRSTTGRSRR